MNKLPDSSKARRQRGFTLVELLVVIAIIAILAALLLPVLSKAKASAQSAVCKSNLRQLGVVLSMYLSDYHHYPATRITNQEIMAVSWVDQLEPYLGSMKGYHPAFGVVTYSRPFPAIWSCPVKNPWCGVPFDYNYNDDGSADRSLDPTLGLDPGPFIPPLGENAVRVPADMIAFCEQVVNIIENPPPPYASIYPTLTEMRFPRSGREKFPHHRTAHAVFCDAHVEGLKQWEFTGKSDSMRRRWNNDHEPHPETWGD
jgi:prepilin-type N-terminal cleavage/methylation domain-containing protein